MASELDPSRPEESPLAEYLDRFLTSRRSKGLAARSLDWYRNHLGVYLRWLAANPHLVWHDPDTLDLFLAGQQAFGLMGNTVYGRYRALATWFAWLRKRRLISDNPMLMIDAPKVEQAPIEYMTLLEYQQLTSSITGDTWVDKRDRVLLYLLFWCGLRISEACDLRPSDIKGGRKLVRVRRGKGGQGRHVPCGDDLYPLVLDYLWSRPPTSLDWLFVGRDGGGGVRGKFTTSGARVMMKRRCAQAKLRYISPHKGRHGLAMEMLNAGLEMSAVSRVLGHSSQKITEDRYARWLIKPLARRYSEVRERLLGEDDRGSRGATLENK